MENILKQKKLSSTPFRLQVLEIFSQHNSAIPVTALEKELGKHDRITLYRTIKTFVDNGIIHEIPLAGSLSTYALCSDTCTSIEHNHNHIHFNCTQCSKVYCLEIEKMPQLKIPNYQIDEVAIQVKGICENCLK
jgi:Fur family ferric uptake transcriptional regulator